MEWSIRRIPSDLHMAVTLLRVQLLALLRMEFGYGVLLQPVVCSAIPPATLPRRSFGPSPGSSAWLVAPVHPSPEDLQQIRFSLQISFVMQQHRRLEPDRFVDGLTARLVRPDPHTELQVSR